MPPPSVTAGVRPYFLSTGHWLAGKKSKPLAPSRTASRHISSIGIPRPKLRAKQDCFSLPVRVIGPGVGLCPAANRAKASEPTKSRRCIVASYPFLCCDEVQHCCKRYSFALVGQSPALPIPRLQRVFEQPLSTCANEFKWRVL